ncbi:MAG: hypothetical protein Q7O66_05635 [Dehalococcoidia bacterium]|nr:hypothetical protein [Dehalococcoidia bacterium]
MSKLVGEYLKDLTSITSFQIVCALRSQVALKDEGKKKLLGELLVEAGYVTREQVDEALRRQRLARTPSLHTPSFDQPFGA